MPADYPWPQVDGVRPVWTGAGFTLGDQRLPILSYGARDSGWSESLTDFHEEAAGAGTHPIDVASRRRARASLKRYVTAPSGDAVILEGGCSSGYLLPELMADWPGSLVIGSDFIDGPLLRLASRLPELPLLRFDLRECPLPSDSVDAVVLLNVLEHIEDHEGALAQVRRVLKPGGVVVIEVPAGPHLFDVYDKHLQHFRRYRLSELCGLLSRGRFDILERSHLGFFVYPPFAAVKRRNRRWLAAPPEVRERVVQESIQKSGGGGGGQALRLAMTIEEAGARFVSYPFGIRCTVAARKR